MLKIYGVVLCLSLYHLEIYSQVFEHFWMSLCENSEVLDCTNRKFRMYTESIQLVHINHIL
jgi:hypothetical protein